MSQVSSLVLVVLALAAVFFAGNTAAVYKVAKGAVMRKPGGVMHKMPMMRKMALPVRKMAPARKTMAASVGGRSVASGPLVGLENVPMYSPAGVAGRRFGN
jgi:hypothetical protein